MSAPVCGGYSIAAKSTEWKNLAVFTAHMAVRRLLVDLTTEQKMKDALNCGVWSADKTSWNPVPTASLSAAYLALLESFFSKTQFEDWLVNTNWECHRAQVAGGSLPLGDPTKSVLVPQFQSGGLASGSIARTMLTSALQTITQAAPSPLVGYLLFVACLRHAVLEFTPSQGRDTNADALVQLKIWASEADYAAFVPAFAFKWPLLNECVQFLPPTPASATPATTRHAESKAFPIWVVPTVVGGLLLAGGGYWGYKNRAMLKQKAGRIGQRLRRAVKVA